MAVLLGLLMGGILSEEHFGYLFKVVERGAIESRTNPMPHLLGWRKR